MTEVNSVAIEKLQARIAELRKPENGGVEKNRAEIEKLRNLIPAALAGERIESSMVGLKIESTENGNISVVDSDSHIAAKEEIDAQKYYTGDNVPWKQPMSEIDKAQRRVVAEMNIKNEFCQPTMTEAEFKEFKKKVDKLNDELKALKKEFNKMKLSKGASSAEYTAKLKELQAKEKEYLAAKKEYETEEILQKGAKGKGVDGIRKAAENNVKNMSRVLELKQVFLPGKAGKEAKERYLAAHPEDKDKVKQLNDNDLEALMRMQAIAEMIIEEATAANANGDLNDEQLAQIKEQYKHCLNMFTHDEKGNLKPDSINTKEVQDALIDYSGFDHRFNFDESEQLAKEINLSKGKINHMVKNFGFGVENGIGKKLAAAGLVAGTALVGNLINGLINKKSDHDYARKDIPEYKFEVYDGTNHLVETFPDEFGNLVTKETWEAMHHTVTGGGGTVEAVADAAVDLLGNMKGILGTFAGPVLAGLTAFLLCKPDTENAFNSMPVATALLPQNLQNVKGDDNKLIMKQIQDFELTGNKAVDLRIKTAIIQAAIGEFTTNANTEELLAGYEALKKFKETIGKIKVPVKPTVPPTPSGPEKPELDIINEPTKEEVRTVFPRMKYREGTWYTSHGYVNEDGSNLTEAERKMVQRALKQDDNRISGVDTNGDGKFDYRDKKVSLPTEIVLPNGKKVKIAPDAYDRIMKLPAKGGGGSGKYGNAVVVRINNNYYVIDKKNNNKKLAGPFRTEAEAERKKAELEAAAAEEK